MTEENLNISLYNYLKFYRCFPEIVGSVSQQSQIVDAVSQQSKNVASVRPQFGILNAATPKLLPWTHYRELIRVEDTEAREWYEQEALREMWSTRTLHRNIASQYYCSDTSEDMARYSVLHGSDQLFQAKYLTYLPTEDQLRQEIELQKQIFLEQRNE